jgi:hypothetical protein
MLTLPPAIMACFEPFASVFSRRVWQHVLVLMVGAILAPGARMESSVLRVMDLSGIRSFQRYHRALNREVWSSLEPGRILLRLLIAAFCARRPARLWHRWDGVPD